MFGTSRRPSSASSASTVIETAPCEKSLRLQAGPDAIRPVRAAVLEEFQKQAELPGFRKGKAPSDLIERKYAQAIREETLHRLTKQVLEQAVKEHHLKPVGPFAVSGVTFTEAEGLTFQAKVEVEPDFTLGSYKGITLTLRPVEVAPAELTQALAQLQESMAQLVPPPAGSPEGTPKERQVPPLDEELANDLGFKTLDELKEHVSAKLREQKQRARAQALEGSLCEELLRRHAFAVPQQLVSHQTERLTRDFKVRLLLAGRSEAQVAEALGKFTEQLRTNAERHVKLGFILERIAEQEQITVEQNEVVEKLWRYAERWKQDPAEVRKTFDAQGLWPSVLSTIRQEKTMALLIAAAAIEEHAPSPQAASL